MRSIEDARAFVHQEAGRRRLRTELALGAAAVGVGLLIFVVLVVRIIPVESTTELSSGDGPPRSTTGSTQARSPSIVGSEPVTAPGGASTGPGSTNDLHEATPTTAPTSPRSTTAPKPGNGPVRPAASAPPGPAGPDAEEGATVSPTAPQSTGAAGATSTTVGAGAATTTTRPRPCTIQDFGATDIGWVSGPTGQPYPDRAAPAGEPTRFVVSVWAKPGTPCMTQAWGQELTVTDATGAVVYQRVHDEGPGRLTEPGRWVLYDGWFGWDPSCAEAAPDGWTTPVCLPVGAGSYLAQLVVAGAALPSLAVSFVAP